MNTRPARPPTRQWRNCTLNARAARWRMPDSPYRTSTATSALAMRPAWVKPSIVMMALWTVAGTMVIFLAALKNVPVELYEVASLDGAGPIRKFFSITLPMISGAMFFNVIVLSIAAFQVFDQAYVLFWRDQSNAAPEASLFYAIYLFQQAFRQFNFGFAAAMAWLLFVIIMLITVIQVRFGNRFVYYEGDR